MSKPFGTTSHSEIAHAFDAEAREHTFVEQIPVPSGRSDGTATVHVKKYQLRLSLEELLAILDDLTAVGNWGPYNSLPLPGKNAPLQARQLRAKILATLGLFED